MFVCRLFHRDHPFEQLEARLLADGKITLGRDPTADWPLGDADELVSRAHCTLSVEDGRLFLRDTSTNGTFFEGGARAPRDRPVELEIRQSIRLGAFTLLVDRPALDPGGDPAATTLHLPLSTVAAEVASDWSDGPPARPAHRDASLLEAFCDGARLDTSAFSAEDPVELMRRIGEVYQQTILGLAALMADRTRCKQDFGLERTTIGAAENNPFKWAPTRKVAEDLLRGGGAGFLSDAEAIRASFEDLSRHLAAIAEGANAAAGLVLQTLAPEAIEAEAKAHASLLRARAAICWEIHNRRYAALVASEGRAGSPMTRAFGDAYGRASGAGAR